DVPDVQAAADVADDHLSLVDRLHQEVGVLGNLDLEVVAHDVLPVVPIPMEGTVRTTEGTVRGDVHDVGALRHVQADLAPGTLLPLRRLGPHDALAADAH